MNLILPRDLLYKISHDGDADKCLSDCLHLIEEARKDKKITPKDRQELVQQILDRFSNDHLMATSQIPDLKEFLASRTQNPKPHHTKWFQSLENLFLKMKAKTIQGSEAQARKILYNSMLHPHAQTCLSECRSLIYRAKNSSTVEDIEKKCDDLVKALLASLQKFGLVPNKEAAGVQNYLSRKLKNPKFYSQKPFERIDHLFEKMATKQMLDAKGKEQVNKLKDVLRSSINTANDFLDQALPALIMHTDIPLLKQQMSAGLWNSLGGFLEPYQFTMPPHDDDQLPNCIRSAVSFLSMVELIIKQESRTPASGDGKELRNYFANIGNFLTYFSPYYNEICQTENQIRAIRKSGLNKLELISVELCNAFLQVSEPIASLPAATLPPALPLFSKVSLQLQPVLPPSPSDPVASPKKQKMIEAPVLAEPAEKLDLSVVEHPPTPKDPAVISSPKQESEIPKKENILSPVQIIKSPITKNSEDELPTSKVTEKKTLQTPDPLPKPLEKPKTQQTPISSPAAELKSEPPVTPRKLEKKQEAKENRFLTMILAPFRWLMAQLRWLFGVQ